MSQHSRKQEEPSRTPDRRRALSGAELDADTTLELKGLRWARGAAFGFISILVALTLIALLTLKERKPSGAKQLPRVAALSRGPRPELFAGAHTFERGARLVRRQLALAPHTSVREGDVLASSRGAGCLTVGSDARVCLADASHVRVASLSALRPDLELLDGSMAATQSGSSGSVLTLRAAELALRASQATFGVERVGGEVTVLVLAGELELAAFGRASQLRQGERARLRKEDQLVEVASAAPAQLARARSLLALGRSAADPEVVLPQRASAPPKAWDASKSRGVDAGSTVESHRLSARQ